MKVYSLIKGVLGSLGARSPAQVSGDGKVLLWDARESDLSMPSRGEESFHGLESRVYRVEGLGFRGLGFRGLGFRGLGV